jgi:hypothetical protein
MKNLIKFFTIFISLWLIVFYIWFRFIRERLPRDIPFNLNLFGCIVILYICFIYLYILKGLIFKTNVNPFISSIVKTIYKPLMALDEAIKNNSLLKPYYEKFLAHFINRIKTRDLKFYLYSYFIMLIFPRIILITALYIDLLYFHCIAILYKVILIGLLIFIAKYIKYSFKYAKEQYILQLEYMVQKIMTDYNDPEEDAYESLFTTMLEPRRFIQIQVFTVEDGLEPWTCAFITTHEYNREFRMRNSLSTNHRFTNNEYNQMEIELKKIMDIVISLSVHISKYEIAENYSRIKYIKIGIFSLYLISWIYILLKSIHTLDIEEIISIIKIRDIIEPFSGLNM